MNQIKRQALINALQNRPAEHNLQLITVEDRAAETIRRDDWLWHLLLSAMSTMGNSRGYTGLIDNDHNYSLASYDTLLPLDSVGRLSNLTAAFRQAKARRFVQKGIWLSENFTFIQDCGGINVIQNLLQQTKGRDSKIRLLKLFSGVGDKYARNIFMEICHPDFINSIAIDERITDISEGLEISKSSIPTYNAHENIFIEIAKDSGLTPWQLDRLLYFFKAHYLAATKNGA